MKHTKHRAFTLIELVIYMAIFSSLGLLVFSWHSMIGDFFVTQSRLERIIIERDVALDVIRRDTMCASRSPGLWDEGAAVFMKEMINGESHAVGYTVRENTLYRCNGVYDFTAKHWIRKTTQVLATGIKAIQTKTYRSHDYVRCVVVSISPADSAHALSIRVLLRNRVL